MNGAGGSSGGIGQFFIGVKGPVNVSSGSETEVIYSYTEALCLKFSTLNESRATKVGD
jgi:hypothetical protein